METETMEQAEARIAATIAAFQNGWEDQEFWSEEHGWASSNDIAAKLEAAKP